jgi:glycosyltransferase involved in cell wall biosynthesis
VQEQYRVFAQVTKSHLLNVQVREGKKLFEYVYVKYAEDEEGYYLLSRIKSHKIIELLTTFLLFWALFRSDYKRYDLLHFHIAYPLLTYYTLWKKFIKMPVLISEHWSAYHYHFYMPKETTKLERVKHIFRQNIPVITVSKALLEDIQYFSGTKDFPATVIPNVVDSAVYRYVPKSHPNIKPTFFIVNTWRTIKNPFVLLEAFAKLAEDGVDFVLRIGGDGALLGEMKQYVGLAGLLEHTVFLGKMHKEQIAKEMQDADAYLFASSYETFSVVCAQALSCGCPLIGPAIPAILEYAGVDELILVESNDVLGWQKALVDFMQRQDCFEHEKIAQKAKDFLSHEKIKKQYADLVS